MGIILTYAINDRQSFIALENWLKQIKMHASENVVKVLVANKCDIEGRQVSEEEGRYMAESMNIKFFEVSAKQDIKITEAFTYMAEEIK
ncbi:UNVERIFIED_CONTAM: hypothetical protein GTU68_013615 [Idotea baltica]|nr:hypothetical protein [Idotea baltica]